MNILDIEFLEKCAYDCLKKKWKRKDVIQYFAETMQLDKSVVKEIITTGDRHELARIAAYRMQQELATKQLHLTPIWYREKIDASSQKVRRIGIQNIDQQLYDYVAVYAMEDMMRRIGEYQCASIPGRGPIWGTRHIRKWLKNPRVKYSAQLDIRKCFPSIPQDRLLGMIDKYVANADVRWLVRQLVETFEQGLSIGSYLSQYLCNLYISQLYHKISEDMYYVRRGKRIRLVEHVLIYMDDILLLGRNAKAMNKAARQIIKYAHDVLGLQIKPDWLVKQIDKKDFIDIMGFRIYRKRVTIRRRVFLRIRRAYKNVLKRPNHSPAPRQAQKCVSYLGIVQNTIAIKFAKKYKIYETAKIAKEVISHESKFRCRAA